jgi:hypothetical protein
MRTSSFGWALLCLAINACSLPKVGSEGDTSGQDPTSDASSESVTDPTTSMDVPVDCAAFADEVSKPQVKVSLRNLRETPIFFVTGPCGEPPIEIVEAVTMNRSPSGGCLEPTCFGQICPLGCSPLSPILIAPGEVGPAFAWDGRLLVPQDMPLLCSPEEAGGGGEGLVQCDALKNAGAGQYEARMSFSSELLGCDPDPCECDPGNEGFCQVYPEMAAIGNEVAIGTFELPTGKIIEVVVQ